MIQDSQATDEAQIRAMIDDWSKALHDKNAEGVVRHQTAALVSFSLAPPLQIRGADVKGLEAWFSTWRGAIGYQLTDLNLAVGGDVAFGHSLNRMSGTKTDGATVDLWFRQTLCFRKIAGAWKMVHEHESVPFYMDGSFKASVDLQP